jgi:hypothetical protein
MTDRRLVMSSPVQNDADKRIMYAPPWAREPQQPQQPQQAIVAAVEHLRQARLRAKSGSPTEAEADVPLSRTPIDRDQPELPLVVRSDPADIEAAMAKMVRATWSPPLLKPVTMPEPPKPQLGGPTWGMFARLSSAVGFAAAVALFVTGAVPLPTFGISLKTDEGTRAAPAQAQAFGRRDAQEPKAVPVHVASVSPAPPLPATAPASTAPLPAASQSGALPPSILPAAALPTEVLSAFASIEPPAKVQPARPLGSKIDTPQASAAPDAKPVAHLALDRDELAGLLKRGQTLLAEGDISSARLLLRRAAEAGDATAALMLAGTYDRAELARLKVIGVAHDNAQAKLWYTKAMANGSTEAMRRLQQLAQRAD